jgi:hypothetical protein
LTHIIPVVSDKCNCRVSIGVPGLCALVVLWVIFSDLSVFL